MSGNETNSSPLESWYHSRISAEATADEVRGYWVFVLGVALGILGILLFIVSSRATMVRGGGIALSAVALVLLMVGTVIRLPLAAVASYVSFAGALLSLATVAAFLVVYPETWRASSDLIVAAYVLGMCLIAVGAVFVPVVRGDGSAQADAERETAETRAELAETEDRLAETREELAAAQDRVAERDERISDLEAEVERLEAALADAEAEREELTEQVAEYEHSKGRFELYQDAADEWRWRLVHRNGNIIGTGGQGYSSKQKAQQGLNSVVANARGAALVTLEREEAPDEDVGTAETAPFDVDEVQAEFEVYEDAADEWRWRLVHRNGNIIADGGQGYTSEGEAHAAVDRVQTYSVPARYLDLDPAGFEVFEDAAGDWRWRLVHRNGNVLGDSGQGYASRTGAREGIESVRRAVAADGADAFEVYEDSAGDYRWRLEHENGNVIADSGGGYADRSGATDAVERVVGYVPEADALGALPAAFEVYEDRGGDWRWRLRHQNGNVLADGGQGYASRTKAHQGIHSVKRNAPNAPVTEEGEDSEGDGAEGE